MIVQFLQIRVYLNMQEHASDSGSWNTVDLKKRWFWFAPQAITVRGTCVTRSRRVNTYCSVVKAWPAACSAPSMTPCSLLKAEP